MLEIYAAGCGKLLNLVVLVFNAVCFPKHFNYYVIDIPLAQLERSMFWDLLFPLGVLFFLEVVYRLVLKIW